MSEQAIAQVQKPIQVSAEPLGILQRKCMKCRKKQRLLQRAGIRAAPDVAPPIVHEALRSSGQPLDRETRAFMEPRFGYEFSRTPVHPVNSQASNSIVKIGQANDDYEQEADSTADRIMRARDLSVSAEQKPRQYWDLSRIRVHTDAKAADSARSVNAQAFTSGQDIVFGAGQFAPGTESGRMLIVHELVHVAQQNSGWQTEDSGFRIASQLIQRSTHTVCDENGCHEEPDEPDASAPDAGSAEEKTPDDASLPRGAPSTETQPDSEDAGSSGGSPLDQSVPPADQSYNPQQQSTSITDASAPEADSAEENISDAGLPGGVSSSETQESSNDDQSDQSYSIPEPRSLSQTLEPSTLSKEELEVEIGAIRNWLEAFPEEPKQEQLREVQAEMENQLAIADIPKPFSLDQICVLSRYIPSYPSKGVSEELINRMMGKYRREGDPGEGGLNGKDCAETPYIAGPGEAVCTYGYGHQIKRGNRILDKNTNAPPTKERIKEVGNNFRTEFACENPNEFISCSGNPSPAEVLLRRDAKGAGSAPGQGVEKVVNVDLNQCEYDALVDMVLSHGNITDKETANLMNAIKWYWCTNEGKDYVRTIYMQTAINMQGSKVVSPGLKNRREQRVWPPSSVGCDRK